MKILALIFICAIPLLQGCGSSEPGSFSGKVKYLKGSAEIFRSGTGKWKQVKLSSKIEFGDSIKTGPESQVEIGFGNDNTIKIDENAKIVVKELSDPDEGGTIEVFNCFGTVLSNIKKLARGRKEFTVRTPTSVAAIRGTFFFVSYSFKTRTSHINVIAGKVWVRSPRGPRHKHIVVMPGHFTMVAWGMAPGVPKRINYGQWKKMHRMMRPRAYKKYTKKFKIKKRGRIKGPGKAKMKIKGRKPGKSKKGGLFKGPKKVLKQKGRPRGKFKSKSGKGGKGSFSKGGKGRGGGKKR
jgi:hypothetical protein